MKKILSLIFVVISMLTLCVVANAEATMTAEIYYQYNEDNSAIRLIGSIKNVNNIDNITEAHYALTLDGTTKNENITTVYETVSGADSSFSNKNAGVYYTVLKLADINDSKLIGKSFSFKLVVNNSIESEEKSVVFGSAIEEQITITESNGAFESAYLKWTPLNGITDYNVYYKINKAITSNYCF